VTLRDRTNPNSPPAAAWSALAFAARGKRATMHWLISLGWIGLFGVSLLDASPIPLPIPGTADLILLVLIAHKASPFLLVPLAVGGSVIGAYLTWSAGKKGGEEALRRYVPQRHYARITRWTKSHGAIAVALAAALPPPVPLLPFLLAAGALAVPRARFLISFTAARTVRYSIVTWLAVIYGRRMVHWWNQYLARYSAAISWTILALFVAALSWGIWKWKHVEPHSPGQEVAEARTVEART
jgi:membrane protein YqaA with SNARE-associated domain